MQNLPNSTPTIEVIVDVTKDQVTDNTADSLQVKLTYTIDPVTVEIAGQSYITSTLVITTTLGELKAQSANLGTSIAASQAQKTIIDSTVQPVTDQVTAALAALQ